LRAAVESALRLLFPQCTPDGALGSAAALQRSAIALHRPTRNRRVAGHHAGFPGLQAGPSSRGLPGNPAPRHGLPRPALPAAGQGGRLMQAPTFARGWELHQAGDLRAAEEVYRGVLRSEPRHSKVWFALAQLCQSGDRLVEAVACARQAIEIEPREADVYFLLGNLHLQLGQNQDAEPAYRRCLELRPDFAEGLGNLGFITRRHTHFAEAQP